MYVKICGAASAALLLSCGVALAQLLPPEHPPHARDIGDLKVGHKALFTLGALAVLGGASYYLGRHVGMHDSQQHGYLGYGYPGSYYSHGLYSPYGLYGHHGGLYGHQAQYGLYKPYKHKLLKGGFSAGVYSSPLMFSGRRKRDAGTEQDSVRTNEIKDNPETTKKVGSSCKQSNEKIHEQVMKTLKNTEPENKQENEIVSGKDESDETSAAFEKASRTRRAAHRPTLVVTSQPISVSDDPYTSNRVEHLSAKVPRPNTKPSFKLRPEPRAPHQSHYNLHSRLRDARVTAVPQVAPETRDQSPTKFRIRQPEDRQQLLCEDGSQARNFEYFELMMLESALSEDDKGCGLGLVCEIGRVPLHLLPPKALGLRRLLTGTKPRGLDGVVWGALTESLLGGLSGNDCSQRHNYCPTPPSQLMSIFSRL